MQHHKFARDSVQAFEAGARENIAIGFSEKVKPNGMMNEEQQEKAGANAKSSRRRRAA